MSQFVQSFVGQASASWDGVKEAFRILDLEVNQAAARHRHTIVAVSDSCHPFNGVFFVTRTVVFADAS